MFQSSKGCAQCPHEQDLARRSSTLDVRVDACERTVKIVLSSKAAEDEAAWCAVAGQAREAVARCVAKLEASPHLGRDSQKEPLEWGLG